jgi:hypothetical protein
MGSPGRSSTKVSGAAGRGDRSSGRATAIAMMQATETGKGDDLAELRRLFGAVLRRVLLQREVHSVLVVPVAELPKQALGVLLVQHDQMVETLAAKGADHPLRERIHPRGS